MGAAVKKPVNIFRLQKLGEPHGVFNWRLWFAVVSFGLLGAARGTDEGLISGTFNTDNFKQQINYYNYSVSERADIKANVSAMVQIGSVGGALIAFIICDRIGRIWAVRVLTIIWALGIAIFLIGGHYGNLGAIYAGRFIAGLGIGQTPVVGPVYIAEIAPASVRGLCTCCFTGAVYLGILLAYFANYGASLHMAADSPNRWLVPTSLHIMMSGIIFILSFFQDESPRYLIKRGRSAEATGVMSHLRQQPADSEYIVGEIAAIQAALDDEMAATEGLGRLSTLRELFTTRKNLYRVYLAIGVQLWSQWSGAGAITLYAVDLFSLLGIQGNTESLLVTAVYGCIKLPAAIACALFLVDVIGRKRALMIGIFLQALSTIYIASFLTTVPQLGIVKGFQVPSEQKSTSLGAIAMIYICGFGWSLGWNSMQYLLTAELFPLRVRAMATSMVMTFHFANQYSNTRALPNMLLSTADGGITPKGTFWCFAAVTVVGGAWVWFSIPETSGRSLESMDKLFDLPWYRIGMYGNEDADEQDVIESEKQRAAEEDRAVAVQVEGKTVRV